MRIRVTMIARPIDVDIWGGVRWLLANGICRREQIPVFQGFKRLAINRRAEGEVLRITNRVRWPQSLFPLTWASGTLALGPACVTDSSRDL